MSMPNPRDVAEQLRSLGVTHAEHDDLWIRVAGHGPLPPSGWKLHISATPRSFKSVLDHAVPQLLDARAAYKVAATVGHVEELNDGRYGLSQVGKVLTVYPTDVRHAIELGNQLAEHLAGLEGPAVSTDAGRWAEDAPIYFRYGAFDSCYRVDTLGRKVRLMTLPEGDVVDDTGEHSLAVSLPDGFPPAVAPDSLAFLRDQFLFVQIMHVSAKGVVLAAVDKSNPKSGVQLIKTARRHAQADDFGRDALWALKREADTLRALAQDAGIDGPVRYIVEDAGDTAALIRPLIEAEPFAASWQEPDARSSARLEQHRALLADLERRVAHIHEQGYVVRDLSPANVLDDDGTARIVDLELAHPVDSNEPPYRRGTRGFYDSARDRFTIPTPHDDQHALQAWRALLDTGVYPEWELDDAPIRAKDHVRSYLRDWCDESPHPWIALDRGNLFTGLAGVLLSTSRGAPDAAADVLSDRARRDRVVQRLAHTAQELNHIPGYYFGAYGTGVALLDFGNLLDDDAWMEQGHALLSGESWQESNVPDLCHGVAGAVTAFVRADAIASERGYLGTATHAAERLLSMGAETPEGLSWPWPEGPHTGLSGERQYGFAHGTAGVVWALSGLARSSPDERWTKAIDSGVRFLISGGRELRDEQNEVALWWPVSEEDERCWNAWSHGTPGVVKALAAAAPYSAAAAAALPCAVRAIGLANNTGYCLCHGIASRLDAYLDALPVLEQRDAESHAQALAQAESDAQLLARMRVHHYEARANPQAGDDGYGWLKGAAGVWEVLARWRLLRG